MLYMTNPYLQQYNFQIGRKQRSVSMKQKPCTIWMSGLSGSGKSTIANCLEYTLWNWGYHTMILDGDNTRLGLNKNLGFSEEDRVENIRRVSEVAKILNDAGIIVICSFISPFEKNREQAKEIIGEDFIEFYVDADLSTCESRDPKGLYKKARSGEIKEFTGISSPFEIPSNAVVLKNNIEIDIERNVDIIIDTLKKNNYIWK